MARVSSYLTPQRREAPPSKRSDLLKKRQECLTEKCNSVFANHKEAKEGCLFLATWMQAAGNPLHKYREVECPADLKAKW